MNQNILIGAIFVVFKHLLLQPPGTSPKIALKRWTAALVGVAVRGAAAVAGGIFRARR